MKCPICNINLTITDRQGIEIDYCPQCRGVWLDRGELDKIIERTSASQAPGRPLRDNDDFRGYKGDDKYYYKKRKNILGDLFDF